MLCNSVSNLHVMGLTTIIYGRIMSNTDYRRKQRSKVILSSGVNVQN